MESQVSSTKLQKNHYFQKYIHNFYNFFFQKLFLSFVFQYLCGDLGRNPESQMH